MGNIGKMPFFGGKKRQLLNLSQQNFLIFGRMMDLYRIIVKNKTSVGLAVLNSKIMGLEIDKMRQIPLISHKNYPDFL